MNQVPDPSPMPQDYFGERVAQRYDESQTDMFEPAVVAPVVDFLADLAGRDANPWHQPNGTSLRTSQRTATRLTITTAVRPAAG